MSDNLFFSFILPAYKSTFLESSIKSILAQTYLNFELIIIDDNSPYDLFEIVKNFNDNRISYIKNIENIGGHDLVKQWNHCIEYAKGDYTILAADDDIFSNDFLNEIINLIDKYPNLNIYRGRNQNIDENNKIIKQELRLPELVTFDEFLLYERNLIRCIGNLVFKSIELKKIRFPEYPLAWQTDIAIILELMNGEIAVTQNIVYSFRVSSIHISGSKDKKTALNKIMANCQYFSHLSILLKDYKYSDEFIKRNIYDIYIKDDDLKFKSILSIIRSLNFFSFLYVLIKTRFLITKKQQIKLLYYYFFRTRI